MYDKIGQRVRINAPDSPWVHNKEGYLKEYHVNTGSIALVDSSGNYVARAGEDEIDFIEDRSWIDRRIAILYNDLDYHRNKIDDIEKEIEKLEQEAEKTKCELCNDTKEITTEHGHVLNCPECNLKYYLEKNFGWG